MSNNEAIVKKTVCELKILLSGNNHLVITQSCISGECFLYTLFDIYDSYIEIPQKNSSNSNQRYLSDGFFEFTEEDLSCYDIVEDDRYGYKIQSNIGNICGYKTEEEAVKRIESFNKDYKFSIELNGQRVSNVLINKKKVIAITYEYTNIT